MNSAQAIVSQLIVSLLSVAALMGADSDPRLADGSTPLHWAAYQDDLQAAQRLVDARADVKAANRYGVTPLSLACTNGNGAMVELLLKAGRTRIPRWAEGKPR